MFISHNRVLYNIYTYLSIPIKNNRGSLKRITWDYYFELFIIHVFSTFIWTYKKRIASNLIIL